MKIEERLRKLSDENTNCSLLWAQWEFDKKLLSRALNTISRDYPHYSLHDSSHSSTIITQIEKVIAPNIQYLSATDCWMLLESCYWHDAGMIITNEEKQRLLNDPDFIRQLKEIAQSDHELALHASNVLNDKKENDIKRALDISNSLTFLIADYFRKIHAVRSGMNVNEPDRIALHSPRTSLIPKRLFNFVAQIVACHGMARESLLNIAKYNDGVDANDYAHPRYIAALLRIGDLLDIDDGRFCPSLLANIGCVPLSSIAHQRKHASIKHLYIDSEMIEIEAECEDYESYHAQQEWFNYIQNEFDYQKRIWNKLVPDSCFRPLPTIEKLNCDIKGFLAINGRAPEITLDHKRIYHYITSVLVYSESYPFVREVIQNAIDATYYKVWLDIVDELDVKNLTEFEIRNYFNEKLSDTLIRVKLEKLSENDVDETFKLVISDDGVGMSLDDIEKIFKVGSETTLFRKKIRSEMPGWAKPTGFFGIGLQTAFTFCDKVSIYTKMAEQPAYNLSTIDVEFNSHKFSLQKTLLRKNGTKIDLIFRVKKSGIGIGTNRFNFDVLKDEAQPEFFSYVLNLLRNDFSACPIKLLFNENIIIKSNRNKRWKNKGEYIQSTDFDLNVDFNLSVDLTDRAGIATYYKGVRFELNKRFKFLTGYLDIFSHDAGYWLTIDRRKGRADRSEELEELIGKICFKHMEYIRSNTKDNALADFYLYSMYGSTIDQLWKSYEICDNELSTYLDGDEPIIIVDDPMGYDDEYGLYRLSPVFDVLGLLIKRRKISISVSELTINTRKNEEDSTISYKLHLVDDSKGNVEIEPSIFKYLIDDYLFESRAVMPCFNEKYKQIAINKDNLPKNVIDLLPFANWVKDFIFLPLKKYDVLGDDVKIIFNYYKTHSLTSMNEESFTELYLDCWSYI
ncbi:ATP-binding protein [Enterobacter bugandensis]|uniref:HD domain-containing protein n=2 Tax=Enterobacter bugandensis TaxID=881260 RepID=UPI0013DFF4CD|nr:ATP-binding protein [Enterobacter bugandensis]ELF8871968.1 ATP-binding protein [Enterobacter bugandensis]ELQ3992167.1 ATP-binding protein [Enterobacter bugandensis]ELV3039675.1 ATP-binding protein [Enterobacter bugandensis]ELX8410311.1 ATP-binding protein [Enterobacter bugandensis]MBT1784477.1 ATP-binding protein [Enterobacter bugandensis]